jgi:hypothetical protein
MIQGYWPMDESSTGGLPVIGLRVRFRFRSPAAVTLFHRR